jgi:hypothetical protein
VGSLNNVKQSQRYIGFGTEERPKGDAYASPEIATVKLLENVSFGNKIWEPAVGRGDISKVLAANGFNVVETDLYDWGYIESFSSLDYVSPLADYYAKLFRPDAVITNPPFNIPRNISHDFVVQGLKHTAPRKGKVAILQRLSFLESNKRKHLFEDFPFSQCLVFSSRLPRMHSFVHEGKKATSMIAFAWFVWDWEHVGPATLKFI